MLYIKQRIFVNSERKKLSRKGTLLNAFCDKKIIFIHIPKTAGISFIRAIYGDVNLDGHRSILFYRKIYKKSFLEYSTFSIVRNPWDRLYSSYKFLQKGGLNIHDRNAFSHHLKKFNDFEDFVLNGLNSEIIQEITHFIPQSKFICDKKGQLLVDIIGKFENIEELVEQLNNEFNLSIKLDHHNANKKECYKTVYSEKMKLKVEEIYKKDIVIFGYSFE